ncbi:hypothetical protein [Streptomyces gilvus]|uniref:hypothetical protein n=1 Tax=Streptomyces gilvus TaxID=2920937 RepID=UPI001F0E47B3|nr:hypothetical protein [Streptomyces sp. CME 23]MCH5674650.1 hypothetical protein [Streptomyces sp. CME 23]
MTDIPAETPSVELLERIRRQRRHILELLTVCAVGLVPWTVLLAFTLPHGYTVRQWRTTWVGFDVLLLLAMASTALLGWRRHRAVIVAAVTTAALLACDAWFDVSLALGTPGVWFSAALAVCVELPLSGFLIRKALGMLSLAQWPPRMPLSDGDQEPDGGDGQGGARLRETPVPPGPGPAPAPPPPPVSTGPGSPRIRPRPGPR